MWSECCWIFWTKTEMLDLVYEDNWMELMEWNVHLCVCEDNGVCCTGELYSYILADRAVCKRLVLCRKLPVSAWLFQTIPARCPELWLQSRHWTWMTMRPSWTGITQQPCATHPPSGRSVYVEVIFAFSCTKIFCSQNRNLKAPCIKNDF